jgi:hypothetical protein
MNDVCAPVSYRAGIVVQLGFVCLFSFPEICFFCQLIVNLYSKSRRRRAAVRTSASYSVSLLTVNLARLVNH